jgi:hypothetical protein
MVFHCDWMLSCVLLVWNSCWGCNVALKLVACLLVVWCEHCFDTHR